MIVIVAIAVASLLAMMGWLRRKYIFVTVYGESMLPAYRPGERVLVRRASPGSVQVGQVVVLSGFGHTRPGMRAMGPASDGPQWILKRIAAIPGDPIPRETVPALQTAAGTQVPAGHLVVLGDNPARSHDSRHIGYLTADRLLGVVLRHVHPGLVDTGPPGRLGSPHN